MKKQIFLWLNNELKSSSDNSLNQQTKEARHRTFV